MACNGNSLRDATMTNNELAVIIRLAGGDNSVRDIAIKIHRDECRKTGKAGGSPAADFMAEIDNPCPDLLLRSIYRKRLIESSKC